MHLDEKVDIIFEHQKKAPVSMMSLARSLGLAVYEAEWEDMTVSGMIKRDPDHHYKPAHLAVPYSGYAIFVNAQHPKVRQRFTMAHEIAHFLKHEKHIGDGIQDDAMYRSSLSNKQEAEANALAADLLMPQALIRQELAKRGLEDPLKILLDESKIHALVKELAAFFKVSELAMAIRLGMRV